MSDASTIKVTDSDHPDALPAVTGFGGFIDLIKVNAAFNYKKIGKNDAKASIKYAVLALKPAIDLNVLGIDVGDKGLDQFEVLADNFLDSILAEQLPDGPPKFKGVLPRKKYTAADVDTRIAALGINMDSVDARVLEKMHRNPKVLEYLDRLSEDNQKVAIAAPAIIQLLITFGPAILELVMNIIKALKGG